MYSSHAVLTKKKENLIVEQSFGVYLTRIHNILFELSMREKKQRKRKEKNNIKVFMINFLICEKD